MVPPYLGLQLYLPCWGVIYSSYTRKLQFLNSGLKFQNRKCDCCECNLQLTSSWADYIKHTNTGPLVRNPLSMTDCSLHSQCVPELF